MWSTHLYFDDMELLVCEALASPFAWSHLVGGLAPCSLQVISSFQAATTMTFAEDSADRLMHGHNANCSACWCALSERYNCYASARLVIGKELFGMRRAGCGCLG